MARRLCSCLLFTLCAASKRPCVLRSLGLRGGQLGDSFDTATEEDLTVAADDIEAGRTVAADEEPTEASLQHKALMPLLETEQDLETALALADDKLVVVDFTADWCGPCRRLAPILESLARKHASRVLFYKVVVPKRPEPGIAKARGVSRLPALQFFRQGEMIHESG